MSQDLLPQGGTGKLGAGMADRDKTYIHLTSHAHEQSWKTEVIAESSSWICFNKHTHLGTEYDHYHQDRPHMTGIVENDLTREAGWIKERGITWLTPVHTLDFETTGASLWAKNESAAEKLKNVFHSEQPNRIYQALIHGSPEEDVFEIDLKLAARPFQQWLMKADKTGKKSLTQCETIERLKAYTLLRCKPVTERHHQVRAHLACRKHPVVADASYGGDVLMLSELKRNYRFKKDRPEKPLMDRAAIHLEQLRFPDPDTGEEICLIAPMHRDWEVAFKYLKQYALVH